MTNQKIDKTTNPVVTNTVNPKGFGYSYAAHAPAYEGVGRFVWNIKALEAVTRTIRPTFATVAAHAPKASTLSQGVKGYFAQSYIGAMHTGWTGSRTFDLRATFSGVGNYRGVAAQKTPVAEAPQGQVDARASDSHRYAWYILNIATLTGATTTSILTIQSPMKTFLLTHAKTGSFIPAYSGGLWVLAQTLYKGTLPALSGSAARSFYITNVKSNKPNPDEARLIQAGYVAIAGMGDTLVTNGPANLSELQKVNIVSKDFNWKTVGNSSRLVFSGFGLKWTTAMLNIGALCSLEPKIVAALPIENDNTRHSVAGALSGAAAAVLTYPLAALKDYTLVQTTVVDGQLKNKSTYNVTSALWQKFTSKPGQETRTFMASAAKQIPLRLVLTSGIFAIISGVGNKLGIEPLNEVVPERFQPSPGKNRHGLFVGTPSRARIEVMAEPKKDTPAVDSSSPKGP